MLMRFDAFARPTARTALALPYGEFGTAKRAACRNRPECGPDRALERRAADTDLHVIKSLDLSCIVGLQLSSNIGKSAKHRDFRNSIASR